MAIACSALLVVAGCGKDTAHNSGPSAAPEGAKADGPARNPYLSAEKYGITHIDSAQTYSFADPIPRGTFHIDPAAMLRVPGVHRTIFGQSNLGNGAYALIEGLPNGDLLFNSVGGPFRAKIAG